jgi:hypothetical protein
MLGSINSISKMVNGVASREVLGGKMQFFIQTHSIWVDVVIYPDQAKKKKKKEKENIIRVSR